MGEPLEQLELFPEPHKPTLVELEELRQEMIRENYEREY